MANEKSSNEFYWLVWSIISRDDFGFLKEVMPIYPADILN